MVLVVSSGEYARGKWKEAMEFFNKATSYAKGHGAVETQILRPVTPPLGQAARWARTTMFDSLAAWGDFEQKRNADPEWQALIHDYIIEKECMVYNARSVTLYEVM